MKKTKQVLMLPTEEESVITKHLVNNDLAPFQGLPYRYVGETFQNQHLYIVSDEQIKEEDWCIRVEDNKIIQCKPNKEKSIATLLGASDYGDIEQLNKGGYMLGKAFKKIIATTNKSLEVFIPHMDCNGMGCDECLHNKLPQIPYSFIEVFIAAYNLGKPITEAEVEYEVDENDERNWYVDVPSGKYHEDTPIKPSKNNLYSNAKYLKLKLQKDNTIEISLVENNPIGTYIAVFVDGEYKNILIVQAEDIDDADGKLREQGWEGWSSLNPVEYDEKGICFAINGLR